MASLRTTIKHALFTYPTLYLEPADVMDAMFAQGGYDWVNGQLVSYGEKYKAKDLKMKYDDLDEDIEELKKRKKDSSLKDAFFECYVLDEEADRMRRQFIEKNIDRITSTNLMHTYFGRENRHRCTDRNVSIQYARGLNFPDDIKKDWGEALWKYLDNWLYCLNVVYGVSRNHDDVSFWPEHAQKLRIAIYGARSRLYPLLHDGKTYASHCAEMTTLLADLFADDKKEEKV